MQLEIRRGNETKQANKSSDGSQTHLWSSWGKWNDPHFFCCFRDMCFLDRLECACRNCAIVETPLFGTKVSRGIRMSIFIFLDPCTYFFAESPCRKSSCKIWSTAERLLEICVELRYEQKEGAILTSYSLVETTWISKYNLRW